MARRAPGEPDYLQENWSLVFVRIEVDEAEPVIVVAAVIIQCWILVVIIVQHSSSGVRLFVDFNHRLIFSL